jgi:hypothetical protein
MMSEKSTNGWPASKDPNEIAVKPFLIKGTKIKFRANKVAGQILAAFAAEFHEKVEAIDNGKLDDWGYCYRSIRNSASSLSNHASGSAIDLNSSKHPLGKEDTFTKAQQKTIQELIKKYGLAWGGNYKKRKDDMHFELACSPDEAAALAVALGL